MTREGWCCCLPSLLPISLLRSYRYHCRTRCRPKGAWLTWRNWDSSPVFSRSCATFFAGPGPLEVSSDSSLDYLPTSAQFELIWEPYPNGHSLDSSTPVGFKKCQKHTFSVLAWASAGVSWGGSERWLTLGPFVFPFRASVAASWRLCWPGREYARDPVYMNSISKALGPHCNKPQHILSAGL